MVHYTGKFSLVECSYTNQVVVTSNPVAATLTFSKWTTVEESFFYKDDFPIQLSSLKIKDQSNFLAFLDANLTSEQHANFKENFKVGSLLY